MESRKVFRFGLMAAFSAAVLMGGWAAPADRALAAAAGNDFDRPGIYGGAGGTYAIQDFDVEPLVMRDSGASVGDINRDESFGFDARLGYRISSLFASEVDFQYHDGFDLSAGGSDIADVSLWSVTFNGKVYLVPNAKPISKRLQLYGLVGLGLVYGEIDTSLQLDDSGGRKFARDETEFMGRFGAGTDLYLTRNVLAFLEYTYNLPSDKLADFRYSSVVFGLQFRY